MRLRDAVPDDADRLAALAREGPVDTSMAPRSLRDMIRDRSVVVAVREDGSGDDADDDTSAEHDDESGRADRDDVVGYVSYDVDEDAVVVHHVVGEDRDTVESLLDEPIGFADSEELPTVVGLSPDDPAADVVEDRGFEVVERRPFGGEEMVRYERP